jgi:chemotaxis protein MotB
MFYRKKTTDHNVWPMFIDVLSTVLMVVIFVMITFFLAQSYLTHTLNDKNNQVEKLKNFIDNLNFNLSETKKEKAETDKELKKLQLYVNDLRNIFDQKDIDQQDLLTSLNQLKEQLTLMNVSLKNSEEKTHNTEQSLLLKIQELQKLQNEYENLKSSHDKLSAKQFSRFQSEFFASLQKAIGDRHDIRVVGDRFVLQSEVLFPLGSAELEDIGEEKLDRLAKIILDISKKIPKNVHWILRIDGHTDQHPIHTAQFPSNWELSTARALCVLKYLEKKGLPPKNLVAAGFGEHQAISRDLNKNRRIEFKLDQR